MQPFFQTRRILERDGRVVKKSSLLDLGLVAGAVVMLALVVDRAVDSDDQQDGADGFQGWESDLAFDRAIGPSDAPYRFVVWTDYRCPACRRFEVAIAEARSRLGDSLAVVYRFYPLGQFSLSYEAALAAECARVTGVFDQVHRVLMTDDLAGDSLPFHRLAVEGGYGDPEQLRECVADETSAVRRAVVADRRRVDSLNVQGTPAVQIGDRIRTGAMSADSLVAQLRRAASSTQGPR